ncbi:MAG: hypothetical protein AAFV88_02960 [Planctomycetota bacterium]
MAPKTLDEALAENTQARINIGYKLDERTCTTFRAGNREGTQIPERKFARSSIAGPPAI